MDDGALHRVALVSDKMREYNEAIRQRDWTRALDLLNDVLHINPCHASALTERCRLRTILGDIPNAITDSEHAMAADESDPSAFLQLAHLLVVQGRLQQAMAVVDEGLQADHTHIGLQHLRAVLCFLVNDFAAAAETAAGVLSSIADAEGDDDAVMCINAAEVFAASVAALRERHAMVLIDRLQLGAVDTAKDHPIDTLDCVTCAAQFCSEAERLHGQDGETRALLLLEVAAQLYRASGDTSNAEGVAHKLAASYKRLGRQDLASFASASVEGFASLSHSLGWAKMTAARALSEAGETAAALRDFTAALTYFRMNRDWKGAMSANLDLAQLHAKNGDIDAALGRLSTLLVVARRENDPFMALRALNAIGECQLRNANPVAAKEALAEALELHVAAYKACEISTVPVHEAHAFVEAVCQTHARIGELCLARGMHLEAMEWLERYRSFGYVDALGELLASQGLLDITACEVREELALEEVDALLSVSRVVGSKSGSCDLHLFLFVGSSGAVYHTNTPWSEVFEGTPNDYAQCVAEMAGGPAVLLQRSGQAPDDPRRTDDVTSSQKRVEGTLLDALFSQLIAPLRDAALGKDQATSAPFSCVVSCCPELFRMPWAVLELRVPPAKRLLRPVVVTTSVAQWRRNARLRRRTDATVGQSNIRTVCVVDHSIPSAAATIEAVRNTPGVTCTNQVPRDASPLLRSRLSAIGDASVVHLGLRWVDRDMLDAGDAAIRRVAPFRLAVIASRPTCASDVSHAVSALFASDNASVGGHRISTRGKRHGSKEGWLFVASPTDSTAPFTLEEKLPVVRADDAVPVKWLAELNLSPGVVVCLDLECGIDDGNVPTETLPRALLTAGAAAVVLTMWSVPGRVRRAFFTTFYASLGRGRTVAKAFSLASISTQQRFCADHWSSFRIVM